MSDVFISYKAEDRRRVQPLVHALQTDGLSVWWDEHIGAGDAWRETIERELDQAKCVLVIWSKRSVGSDGKFVREEASRAQRRGVYVPVLIDAVDPPLGFGESQATSLRGWHGSASDGHYQAVLSAVRRNVGGKRRASRSVVPHRGVDRRTVIAGGTVAALAVGGIGAWALLKPGSAAAASDSVAVLPFENLSGNPAEAYFSDGIAEEIRSALARIGGLTVIGRTSSEAVRNDDTPTAAKKLGVGNILTGSVRQSQSTIRITAELVDGRTGADRWSQDYDRSPGDSIEIQTDIAENVAQALIARLGSAARAAIMAGGTANAAAQNLYLQAQQVAYGSGGAGVLQAIALLDRAIALDPRYAAAVAFKAMALNAYASVFSNGVPELLAYRSRALDAAKSALEIAPDYGGAHHAMAFIDQVVLNLPSAVAEYGRALELAPSDAPTLSDYSHVVSRLGRFSDALQLSDKAIAVDPLSPRTYNERMAVLVGGRRYADALRFAEELQRTSPKLYTFPELTGLTLVLLGRFSEAQHYFDLTPADSYQRIVFECALLKRTGRAAQVPAKIDRLRQLYGDAASYQYAEIYAQLGDKDRAFAAFDRAWEIRDSGLLNLKVDVLLDPLRTDPRLAALINKVGFPA